MDFLPMNNGMVVDILIWFWLEWVSFSWWAETSSFRDGSGKTTKTTGGEYVKVPST